MSFTSPLWLLALIPWAGVAIWLLVGRNPRVMVPFVELWRDTESTKRRASFAIQRPPIALACVLLAMLLALLAAAQPTIERGKAPIRVIVDRGVTVQAEAADRILDRLGPSERIDVAENLISIVQSEREPIVVISNQELGQIGNVVQISPNVPVNIGIVRVAVREIPKPALMLTLRNQSDIASARVRVTGAAERSIDLPARSATRDYFFDLGRIGEKITVELIADDAIKADNTASLIQQSAPPAIDVRSTISPEMQRMIEVYVRHRPPADSSSRIVVADLLSGNESGVIVASGTDHSSGPIRVSDHPLTANVKDWDSVVKEAMIARTPSGDGWSPIVQSSDRVLVAVRQTPSRQVWIGFQSDAFARSAGFVIFWTNVFDWLGGASGASEFRPDPANVLDLKLRDRATPPEEWQPKLAAMRQRVDSPNRVDLARPLILAALVLIAFSALYWQRNHSPVPQKGLP